jgi:hypothetical protein
MEAQDGADLNVSGSSTRGDLEDGKSRPLRHDQPPWTHAMSHVDDAAVAVKRENVDREPHETSMDRRTGDEEQAEAGRRLGAPLEANQAGPETVGNFEALDDGTPGASFDEPQLVSHLTDLRLSNASVNSKNC